jgi:hypothetical protein
MIQTVLRREYMVACDGCGLVGPAKATADQAHQRAHEDGWQPITALCGFAFLTTWLCPDCQQSREAQ